MGDGQPIPETGEFYFGTFGQFSIGIDIMTPYAKLRSLPDARGFLKPRMGFALLDAVVTAETDLEAARRVQAERRELFRRIGTGGRASRRPGRVLPVVTAGFFTPSPAPHRVPNRPIPRRFTRASCAPIIPPSPARASDTRPRRGSVDFTLAFSLDSGFPPDRIPVRAETAPAFARPSPHFPRTSRIRTSSSICAASTTPTEPTSTRACTTPATTPAPTAPLDWPPTLSSFTALPCIPALPYRP